MMRELEALGSRTPDLNVSFGYRFSSYHQIDPSEHEAEKPDSLECEEHGKIKPKGGSFSGLSGAAISANFTLANTNIGKGLIGAEILPEIDSPNSFKKLTSSPTFSRLSTSTQSSCSSENLLEFGENPWKSMSAPTYLESCNFLNTTDVQMAGGAAGEDRVQAVCSEKNGWLICGIYDGFNGRDAADFLAGTLYDSIMFYLYMLERRIKQQNCSSNERSNADRSAVGGAKSQLTLSITSENEDARISSKFVNPEFHEADLKEVLDILIHAVNQAETDFLSMVGKEMDDRPDLVCVGSCVLVVLLHRKDLYVLNLGDSRAVLARSSWGDNVLEAIQLTETHTVDNESEHKKLLADHPDDSSVVINGRVKGKLKLTRALGVGYLKKKEYNDAVMGLGLIRVSELISPPYVHTNPHTLSHKIDEDDLFVVLGSDGLFDVFSNNEVVQLVYQYLLLNPTGDPATHLIERLLHRAAENAGVTVEDLVQIPVGRRRKYHDDVTVIVIIIGSKQRIMTASTKL